MEQSAKCPHCNAELEGDECYDTSNWEFTHIEYIAGHCPQCGKEYQWKRIFDYRGAEDIEEC